MKDRPKDEHRRNVDQPLTGDIDDQGFRRRAAGLQRIGQHIPLKICTVWLLVNQTEKSVWKSILPKAKTAHELRKMLYAWKEQADKLSSEEISKDKYDEWRYHYPEFDTTQTWAKVPSQALSDALVEMFQDRLKPDK